MQAIQCQEPRGICVVAEVLNCAEDICDREAELLLLCVGLERRPSMFDTVAGQAAHKEGWKRGAIEWIQRRLFIGNSVLNEARSGFGIHDVSLSAINEAQDIPYVELCYGVATEEVGGIVGLFPEPQEWPSSS
jgi:hypothetical protein